MSNLKAIRPIHPNNEALDGPADKTATATEMERMADSRALQVARAMTRTDADRDCNIRTKTPRRDEYQRHLRMCLYSLGECEKLNPNESHALNLIMLDIKNLLP